MNKKNFEKTILIQFLTLAKTDNNILTNINVIKNEFDEMDKINLKPANRNRQNLYKILHATRMLDSGMKTFLQIYGKIPVNRNQWSLGGYLKVMKNGGNGIFEKLNGNIADRIQENVIDKRNLFLHVAGKYPGIKETDDLINEICAAMQTVLNLAK